MSKRDVKKGKAIKQNSVANRSREAGNFIVISVLAPQLASAINLANELFSIKLENALAQCKVKRVKEVPRYGLSTTTSKCVELQMGIVRF